jgi:hypothetical protein
MGAMRAAVEKWRGGLTESRGSLYHLSAEVTLVHSECQGSCRGNRECVAVYRNSPGDWSGSERTGIPILLPVGEAANEL